MTAARPFCNRCPGRLDFAAVSCGAGWCTDCEAKDIRQAIAEGVRRKVRGQAAASAAHPDDRARVEAAIRRLAASGQPFSANDARSIHGVKGGVVGATFTALKTEGLIRRIGREASTSASTHGHEIGQWVAA